MRHSSFTVCTYHIRYPDHRRRPQPRPSAHAWLNPPDTPEADLKKRTLTNLYNQRPTWLADAHRALDEAVFAAYGWPDNITNSEILSRLLALNHERAAASEPPKGAASKSARAKRPRAAATASQPVPSSTPQTSH